jgi:hypothetical protein
VPANDDMPPGRPVDVGEGSWSLCASTSGLSSSARSTSPSDWSSTSLSVDGVVMSSRICSPGAPGAGPARGAGGITMRSPRSRCARSCSRADTGRARAARGIAMPIGIGSGIIGSGWRVSAGGISCASRGVALTNVASVPCGESSAGEY